MIIVTGLQVPAIVVRYKNHRGETSVRKFRPLNLYWGSSEWHPEPQMLMEGWDEDKRATRTFAVAGILGPAPANVRVWWKDGSYSDVPRGTVEYHETQPDWDRTEEIDP